MPYPSALGMTTMLDLKNNKQRGQLCTLVVRREKRNKKHKQSIIDDNPTIIYLHAPHHVKEGTTVHPVKRRMTRFSYREASYTPP
jgi:hypothetical protein